ncbi:MAG: hypothetical protein SGPRY_006643, partial [Prymnesium sp.]
LMETAEWMAGLRGYSKLAVISGVGTRNYYRKLGYKLHSEGKGGFMIKKLSWRSPGRLVRFSLLALVLLLFAIVCQLFLQIAVVMILVSAVVDDALFKLAIRKGETREEAVDRAIQETNLSGGGDQKQHQTGKGSSGEPAQLAGNESMFCGVNAMLTNATVSAGPAAAAEGTSKLQRKRSRPDRFDPYAELTAAEQQRLLGREPHEATAMQHIQQALLEMIDEEEPQDTSGGDLESDVEITAIIETEMASDDEGNAEPREDNSSAGSKQQHVTVLLSACHRDVPGALALKREELLWAELNAASPSLCIALAQVKGVTLRKEPRASPFTPPFAHLDVQKNDGSEVVFDLQCASGSSLVTLRAELQKVAQLRHAQKIKEADTLFASVDDTPSDASTASRAELLAKQRVHELRDCCFSMGGLSLTRRILERFLNTPEVRLLLPEAVRKQREEAVDSETSKILLKTAKIFLTKLFKAHASEKAKVRRGELEAFQMLVTLKLSEMSHMLLQQLLDSRQHACDRGGGRRSDEDRNAVAAVLAALLPADLFESRRDRRGAGVEYEVSYTIVNEFWHSELASDPDDQNKRKVRVDMGRDESSGERLYDLHDQRAQCGTVRTFNIFKTSAIAARLRDATHTFTRPDGVKLGWRQFLDAKCECIKERKPSECLNSIKLQIALDAEEDAWAAAAAAAPQDTTSAEALAVDDAAQCVRDCRAAIVKRDTYESMTLNIDTLHRVMLLPCGQVDVPEYTPVGASTFKTYRRECVYGSCAKRIFRGAQACGWDRQCPVICPLETSDKPFSWRVWKQRVSGKNDEGQPTYTPEFSWSHGSRVEFINSFQKDVTEWLPHLWRDKKCKNKGCVSSRTARVADFAMRLKMP